MEGTYLYCIADGGTSDAFGRIGIEGSEVYSIPFRELSAVVHDCSNEQSAPLDKEKMVGLAVAHHQVVEEVWQGTRTVIPVRFGTVVKGHHDGLYGWVSDNYENLLEKVERFRDKEEYGIKVFWNADIVAERLVDSISELKDLKRHTETVQGGAAYLYKQLYEKKLKQEMNLETGLRFRELYIKIKERVDELKIEKMDEASIWAEMIMNISCLVHREKALDLMEELDLINKTENFFVRLTGPWPPYSFAELGETPSQPSSDSTITPLLL